MIQRFRSVLLSLMKQPNTHTSVLQGFIPKLKDHLLSRLLNREYDSDEHTFSSEEWNSIQFVNNLNKVLHPKRLQINYTTIFAATKTRCIQGMVLQSCYSQARMVQMLIPSGTQKS